MKKISTLLSAVFLTTCTMAQIPNAGFETWTNMGSYSVPGQWDNLNIMTTSMSTYTCMQGTPGNTGSSYLKLVSRSVTGMGVMPGIAVSGVLDMSSMTNIRPKSGFAFTGRPGQLTGNWQYMAYGSDMGFIGVLLTKWNTTKHAEDTIATAYQTLSGMAMSWAPFSINFTYVSSATPDSAIIVLSSSGASFSGPVANSYLYVDDLAFAGAPSAVTTVGGHNTTISVYPNPATSVANIEYNSNAAGKISVSITDMEGKKVTRLSVPVLSGTNTFPINTSGLPKGFYFINISDEERTQTYKLIVQ